MQATSVRTDIPRDEQVLQLVNLLRPICRQHPKIFLDASKIVLRLEAAYWDELRQAKSKEDEVQRKADHAKRLAAIEAE